MSMQEPKILLVDDEPAMLDMLKRVILRKCPCKLKVTTSGIQAISILKEWSPDVLITDIKMPDLDGLELLRRVKEFDESVSVIIMTGYGTIEIAVEALKEGAYDFFQKPFDNDRLVHTIKRSLERTRLLRENRRLQERIEGQTSFHGIVGRSQKLRNVIDLISKVADTDVTVLIRGESGTGKELAARALHMMSSRSKRKMITINCPALPEHILESELFGYKKGAFTGAEHDKQGLFVAADGSTILLDEIGDIPIPIQTKLLRVLQEKEIRPLGQTRDIKVDVRVVASTNQDLESKIKEGLFREDLFYRLNVVTITMPSLAEIPEDIPILANHFLKLYSKEYNRTDLEFSPHALKCMMQRPWKGNVRELQNVIKKAVLLCTGSQISPSDLQVSDGNGDNANGITLPCLSHLGYKEAKEEILTFFSRAYISQALKKSKGNVTLAAKNSGLERQALQRLMRRYGLNSSDFK